MTTALMFAFGVLLGWVGGEWCIARQEMLRVEAARRERRQQRTARHFPGGVNRLAAMQMSHTELYGQTLYQTTECDSGHLTTRNRMRK